MPEVTKPRVFFVLLAGLVGAVAGMLAPPAQPYEPSSSTPQISITVSPQK